MFILHVDETIMYDVCLFHFHMASSMALLTMLSWLVSTSGFKMVDGVVLVVPVLTIKVFKIHKKNK